LERAGYIRVDVVAGTKSRMCIGLAVHLLRPLFAKHHAQKWPVNAMNSGATSLSQNYRSRYKPRLIPRIAWAAHCCEAIHRSYMKTLAPFTPLS
jgi:hypothetical protein